MSDIRGQLKDLNFLKLGIVYIVIFVKRVKQVPHSISRLHYHLNFTFLIGAVTQGGAMRDDLILTAAN